MNREILFRGKRIIEPIKIERYAPDGWVYGNLIDCSDEMYIDPKDISGEFYVEKPYRFRANDFECTVMVAQVDPKTIGQFTGLTDKNGKMIFEGDLLKGFDFPFMGDGVHGYFAEVVHLVDAPAYALRMRRNPQAAVMGNWEGVCDRYFLCSGFDSNSWEIIGNVFDNQELLKAQQTKAKKETKQKKGYEYNRGVIAGAQALVDKAKEKHMPIITLDKGTFYAVKESVLDDALKRISEEYKC